MPNTSPFRTSNVMPSSAQRDSYFTWRFIAAMAYSLIVPIFERDRRYSRLTSETSMAGSITAAPPVCASCVRTDTRRGQGQRRRAKHVCPHPKLSPCVAIHDLSEDREVRVQRIHLDDPPVGLGDERERVEGWCEVADELYRDTCQIKNIEEVDGCSSDQEPKTSGEEPTWRERGSERTQPSTESRSRSQPG